MILSDLLPLVQVPESPMFSVVESIAFHLGVSEGKNWLHMGRVCEIQVFLFALVCIALCTKV